MGLGRVLAPRFQPCTCLYPLARWAAPSAARDFLFAQFAGGAGRWPSYGVIADRWPQPRQADGSRTCARCRDFRPALASLSVGGAAPSAARDFLFAQFAGGAGRWPSYGVIGDRWPQPGKLMGLGRVLAAEISAGTLVFIRWRGRRRALRGIFFLHNSPAALAAGRATG